MPLSTLLYTGIVSHSDTLMYIGIVSHSGSLVNHASHPAEESLANMRTLSRARLSTKIVDNQLDACLRFSVGPCILSRARLSTKIVDNQLDACVRFSVGLCERVQVQQHS